MLFQHSNSTFYRRWISTLFQHWNLTSIQSQSQTCFFNCWKSTLKQRWCAHLDIYLYNYWWVLFIQRGFPVSLAKNKAIICTIRFTIFGGFQRKHNPFSFLGALLEIIFVVEQCIFFQYSLCPFRDKTRESTVCVLPDSCINSYVSSVLIQVANVETEALLMYVNCCLTLRTYNVLVINIIFSQR